jgi:Protein of unknown function (DUF1214)
MQSPSDFAAATARVALTDDTPEELKLVNDIQDGITLMSLSQWVAAGKKAVKAEDVPLTKGSYPTSPGMESVKEPGKLKGGPLSGEHRYTITFDLQDLPPVTEFWEIPLYDHDGYFVDNPINRYSLNSYMLNRGKFHTENGKLVIYVQADEPTDPNQKKNWLPCPKSGGFQFAARFYGPHGPLIDGSYNMPGVVRVE